MYWYAFIVLLETQCINLCTGEVPQVACGDWALACAPGLAVLQFCLAPHLGLVPPALPTCYGPILLKAHLGQQHLHCHPLPVPCRRYLPCYTPPRGSKHTTQRVMELLVELLFKQPPNGNNLYIRLLLYGTMCLLTQEIFFFVEKQIFKHFNTKPKELMNTSKSTTKEQKSSLFYFSKTFFLNICY